MTFRFFSISLDEHISHVCLELTRLLEYNVFVKAEKCNGGGVARTTDWKEVAALSGVCQFLSAFHLGLHRLPHLSKDSLFLEWCSAGLPRQTRPLWSLNSCSSGFRSSPSLTPVSSSLWKLMSSASRVGTVLSHLVTCLHPSAFFSLCLSPTEQNYDVGNWELLAVKLALEEWRLDGAEKPFTIWMNHKNLVYIPSAKRLNPRQARWALFVSRFNFMLT